MFFCLHIDHQLLSGAANTFLIKIQLKCLLLFDCVCVCASCIDLKNQIWNTRQFDCEEMSVFIILLLKAAAFHFGCMIDLHLEQVQTANNRHPAALWAQKAIDLV